MKIAILGTRGIPARYGGFETFAEKLTEGLTAHGIDVTVYCEANEYSAPEIYLGAKLCYICAPSFTALCKQLYSTC